MSVSMPIQSQIPESFPDELSARLYLESRRWPSGPVCPDCGETHRISRRPKGFYRCNACRTDFTVRTGTVFERSHIRLSQWVYAMNALVRANAKISSIQLGKELGVTQKSAWFIIQRLRKAIRQASLSQRATTEPGRAPITVAEIAGGDKRSSETPALQVSDDERLLSRTETRLSSRPPISEGSAK